MADIIIGTPGRLLDLIKRGKLKLSKIKFLVLDEGDRMFDMGFIKDINEIISHTPKERQTMLFSATVPNEIKKLIKKYMHEPHYLKIEEQVSEKNLKQSYYSVGHNQKMTLITNLLKKNQDDISLIFCNTKRITDLLKETLNANGIKAEALHGDLNQRKREVVTLKFREGKIKALVATDVAARGLDIQGITKVYNFDSPDSTDTYIHRIGRTARIGKKGEAISIVSEKDSKAFRPIYFAFEKTLKQNRITPDLMKPITRAARNKNNSRNNFSRKGFADTTKKKPFRRKFPNSRSNYKERRRY